MKHANKFMVVPYEEKKVVFKSSDRKITDILSNLKIKKDDKVKLINQILIQNQNQTPNGISTNNNVNESIQNNVQDYIDNYDNSSQHYEIFNETPDNQKRKSILKTPQKKAKKNIVTALNKKLDTLNASINSGYLNLAPSYSTRNNTNKFSEIPPEVSLSTVRPRKRKSKTDSEVGDNKVRKLIHDKTKSARKSIVDTNRLNETNEIEMTSQAGNGWSYYKR